MRGSHTTGTFDGTPAVHALQNGIGGEHTFCGLAFDVISEQMHDNESPWGAWTDDPRPRLVTCEECQNVIRNARLFRLSSVTVAIEERAL